MTRLSQLVAFTVLAAATLAGAAPAKRQIGQTFTGDATFYIPGTGACGIFNTAQDHIVAVSGAFYDTFPGATPNPNNNPICGRQMTVTYQGRSTTVTVTDRCVGCALHDIDLSPAAFTDLAPESAGRIQVSWVLH
ncbi:RlpA-like double-psi beta-barrel-protein domain-containing protein-containing protein [Irpex rosettiformis]|uniref:RlpA-like double-psi beta-barrel-protein domain-containing protein-containing protein n=1 Tax=Irpex rosettiformis TaxID=378272 RepID=A0ACB8UDG7_9APHY|nr:RlpA-like double-psi beta-barrel-protein domain-containing protein-containing protein [Irpex rosettiformis]